MTANLNHGVKAKMCETTPFFIVNIVGAHYVASRAHIEQACDSLRSQGQSNTTCIGLSNGLVHPMEESSVHIVKSLLRDVNNDTNSTVLRKSVPVHSSQSSGSSIMQALSSRMSPMERPVKTDLTADIKELQTDVIIECYPEAKYYHYDPADVYELLDFNVNAENLVG